MKKIILTVLAAIGLAVLVPVTTLAAAGQTDVTGTVTFNGNPVSGAHVIVICNSIAKHVTTNGSGSYLAVYKISQCPTGSNVTVTATQGKRGGENNGKANPVTTDLNVALVNVSLPEFGLVTGIGATVLASGAFLVLRRRSLSGHQS